MTLKNKKQCCLLCLFAVQRKKLNQSFCRGDAAGKSDLVLD